MTERKRLISICVPVFNEERNIEPLYAALVPVMQQVRDRYDFELLFTDNHSTDRTFQILTDLARRDPRVRAIRFSRNSGFQRSISPAYTNARGDAVVQIDRGLQDPPPLIPNSWPNGKRDIRWSTEVRAICQEQWWMNVTRKIFYRLIDSLSEDPLPHDAGDFSPGRPPRPERVAQARGLPAPYLRGTIATLGFEQIGISYARAERQRGESKFSFGQLLGLALDGILQPLRCTAWWDRHVPWALDLGHNVSLGS